MTVWKAAPAGCRVPVRVVGAGGGGLKRDGWLALATAGARAVLKVSRPQNLEVAGRRTADTLVESTTDFIIWHVVQQSLRHTVNLIGGGLSQNIFGRDLPFAEHPLEPLFVHFPLPHSSGATRNFPIYARVWIAQWKRRRRATQEKGYGRVPTTNCQPS